MDCNNVQSMSNSKRVKVFLYNTKVDVFSVQMIEAQAQGLIAGITHQDNTSVVYQLPEEGQCIRVLHQYQVLAPASRQAEEA